MIQTAEEFWSIGISSESPFSMLTELRKSGMAKHVFEAMRRFTKLHVTEALKQASEKAEIRRIMYADETINKDSILEAYSLDNIK